MELLLTSARLTRAVRRIPYILFRRSTFTSRPRAPIFSPPPARRHFEYIAPDPSTTKSNKKPDLRNPDRRPTNHLIPFDHVLVVDPETNKLSRTKHALKDLLEAEKCRRGPERRIVELVASTPDPIVRITTRAEVEARYKEMKRVMKRGSKASETPKEVQLAWGVGRADLEHKLRKAARDLDKGYRVVVVVLMKRRHRPSCREELMAFADEMAQMLSEAGEEWKEREITDRTMVLSFRGKEGST